MDKAWVNLPRPTLAYMEGVRNFVAVSLKSLGNPSKIRCPCTRCRNLDYQTSDDVVSHLVMFGMDKTYDVWIFHGEERPNTSSKMTCDLDDISDTYTMFVEDALSHTLEPERNGRVRGLGFGSTPSKIDIYMNNSKKVQALETKVSELTQEVEKIKQFMLTQGFASKEKTNSRDNLNGKSPSPLSHNSSSNVRDCRGLVNSRDARTSVTVDRKCKLLNWRKIVVAEAKIASTDPNALVHLVPIGNDAWKVWVQVALVPNAELWRPNSDESVMKYGVGTTIAWPKEFVSFE